jgi:Domain of unknown function (DUF4149)
MNLLRFLMLLSLTAWIGGLIFLPMVAQISFTVLPSQHLAGMVVRALLIEIHWIGMVAALVYLACSLSENRVLRGRWAPFRPSHLVIIFMLALTAISQFTIIPRMDRLRLTAGEMSALPPSSLMRMEFDLLHLWSTRIEATVMLLGLIGLYLTTRRFAAARR